MTALIIDDEASARSTLRELLTQKCPTIKIIGEANGVAKGIAAITSLRPEVVFLDVRMKDGTGFDLLEEFLAPDFEIIMTTAYEEFALKAFVYNAIHYLLKPIDPQVLVKAVERLKQKKNANSSEQISSLLENFRTKEIKRITLSTEAGYNFVQLENIIRLEAFQGYTTFYLKGGDKVVVSNTIKTYEDILSRDMFFRVDRSHIVNCQHVKKILREDGGYAVMSDGSKVPIARRRKDEFMNILNGANW